ncbi:hypothetical protein U9M48_002612 [Paspalum notatum var. saurae]|uniref:Uncharacterized protein n=1 Tax=Paspalum notatum var. saurae TaxID=547442 RepID=A0AAQ3SG89_PASNO
MLWDRFYDKGSNYIPSAAARPRAAAASFPGGTLHGRRRRPAVSDLVRRGAGPEARAGGDGGGRDGWRSCRSRGQGRWRRDGTPAGGGSGGSGGEERRRDDGAQTRSGRRKRTCKITKGRKDILSNISVGNAQHCKLSDLVVTQTAVPSGGDAKLSCAGFSSAMGINPDVLSADGKLCTLNGGRPNGMGANYAIRFSYAWRSKIDLKPVSSTRK